MNSENIRLLSKDEMEKLSFAELSLYLQAINKIRNQLNSNK